MNAHELSIEHFPSYFSALWSTDPGERIEPFPWQTELVRKLDADRAWPNLVDLPTGSGKTSIIDIAVFLLALDGNRDPGERWMPRRVVTVVDRRVVVDQADGRARTIASRLTNAQGVLALVTDGLRRLCPGSDKEGGPPLNHTVLRGGIVRDETWARRPDVPAIISSTVDQVGSRLLFRGYGVSRGMRPIHAGLLANDTLFLLDEVHLARPFAETLQAVRLHRTASGGSATSLPDRWHVVEMTATPSANVGSKFPLSKLEPGSHPVLHRRLTAPKPADLVEVAVARDPERATSQFAAACAAAATRTLEGTARTIGVIVNRVDAARQVARILSEAKHADSHDLVLLTGRMRSIERDRILQLHRPRLENGRTREGNDRPLIVVATQSIEAGADFDLDAIVTECASLDALRQRFGRVDRDGQLGLTGSTCRSTVLVRSSDTASENPDPIYGNALRHTWEWLGGIDDVDFGLSTDFPTGDDAIDLLPDPEHAPLLFPGHLDRWVQTSQPPSRTEPDVAHWLHGTSSTSELADVTVIWRSDLDESLFSRDPGVPVQTLSRLITNRVAICAPASGEGLAVPLRAFRAWNSGTDSRIDEADVEGHRADEEAGKRSVEDRKVLRWASGQGEMVDASTVRPGETVLVPATRGGVWRGNWDPAATELVSDLFTEASATQRHRAVLRLIAPCLPFVHIDAVPDDEGSLDEKARITLPSPDDLGDLSPTERADEIRETLRLLAQANRGTMHGGVAAHLAETRHLEVRAVITGIGSNGPMYSFVASTAAPFVPSSISWDLATSMSEDDGRDSTSFTGSLIAPLDEHLQGVGAIAAEMATNLGLSDALTADLRLAGELHDAGKADPRFQRWLHGGDEMAAALAMSRGELLAKSAMADTDRKARQQARELSGYPPGTRHELLSVAMLGGLSEWRNDAHDPELVHHLVASHHGFGRYRFDPVTDANPVTASLEVNRRHLSASSAHGIERLDRGLPTMFWRLVRRYGWFQLAWLEAMLRLADHTQSRLEQNLALAQPDGGGQR